MQAMSVDSSKATRGKRLIDRLALLGAALLLIAVGGSAFLLAGKYRVSEAWVFGAWAAAFFFLIVGWGYRRKFREPAFVSFFVAWTLLHVLVYLLVLAYLGLLWYVPIMVLELWVGYSTAIWQFGPPPDKGIR
jgi:phosphotransferase system  glucose/maltose/N-acetylglucosamine-specific IIC component